MEGREEVVVVDLDQDLGQVMVPVLDPKAVKDMVLVFVEEAEAVVEVEVVAVAEATGQVLAMGLVAAQAMVLVVG